MKNRATTPMSARQYKKRMRKLLKAIVRGQPLGELSQWDKEILNACVERNYLVDNVFSKRLESGDIALSFIGEPRLTCDGYEFLAKIDADSRSRKSLVLSIAAFVVSVVVGIASILYQMPGIRDALSSMLNNSTAVSSTVQETQSADKESLTIHTK